MNREQLNLSIRWVNDVFEDPVGLFAVPNTASETLIKVILDMLQHIVAFLYHFVGARYMMVRQTCREKEMESPQE